MESELRIAAEELRRSLLLRLFFGETQISSDARANAAAIVRNMAVVPG
jgi:hypothetical protein